MLAWLLLLASGAEAGASAAGDISIAKASRSVVVRPGRRLCAVGCAFTSTQLQTAVNAGDFTTAYGAIAAWDTSQVTSFNPGGSYSTGLFSNKGSFNQAIGRWNTAVVTTMYATFYSALAS